MGHHIGQQRTTPAKQRRWGTDHAGSQAGFTLVELVVVLFLFGMLLAFVLPSLGRSGNLAASSRQLVGDLRTLHSAAGASKRLHRLQLDLDQRTYWSSAVDSDRETPVAAAPSGVRTQLPDGIRIRDITTATQGKISTGRAFIQLFPSGRIERSVIHLEGPDQQFLTLLVSPVTGHVEIREGYQDPPVGETISSRLLPYMMPVASPAAAPRAAVGGVR